MLLQGSFFLFDLNDAPLRICVLRLLENHSNLFEFTGELDSSPNCALRSLANHFDCL